MPEKTIDAILASPGKIPGATQVDRAIWVNQNFGPLMGVRRVHGREVPGGLILFTPKATDTLHHDKDGPLAGLDRYEWAEVEPGLRHGFLAAEARAEADA